MSRFMIYGALIWIIQSLGLSTLSFYVMDALHLDESQGLQMSAIALAAGFAWYERSQPGSRMLALVATLGALRRLVRDLDSGRLLLVLGLRRHTGDLLAAVRRAEELPEAELPKLAGELRRCDQPHGRPVESNRGAGWLALDPDHRS